MNKLVLGITTYFLQNWSLKFIVISNIKIIKLSFLGDYRWFTDGNRLRDQNIWIGHPSKPLMSHFPKHDQTSSKISGVLSLLKPRRVAGKLIAATRRR